MSPKLRAACAPAGLFALAILVRALPYGEVFTEDGIRFVGTDPYFHMRAIAWTIEHFPSVQTFDPFIQYPNGARPIVGPLFDWVIALLALPFTEDVSGAGLTRLEHLAVWIPSVLGGLTVVTTWALAKRSFNPAVALIAGAFLSVASGHFWYSRLGMVDHHVAVALLAALQLAFALRLINAPRTESPALRYRTVVGLGFTVAASFLVWPGSLLHLALIDGPLLATALFERDRSAARSRAFEIAAVHGLAAALVFPLSWGNDWPHLGPFSPVVLSEFQPWALACIGIGLAISGLSWSHSRLGASSAGRLGTVCLAGLSLLGASLLFFPTLTEGLDLIRQWLSRTQGFAAYQGIGEARPILIEQGLFDTKMALERLSYFFFVFPVAVVGLGFSARKDPDRASTWSVLFWATGLFVATLMQRRFFNSFSIGLALVTGLALVRLHAACGTGLFGNVPRRWAGGVILIGTLLAAAPMFASFAPYLSRHAARLEGRPVDLTGLQRTVRVHHRISNWLRENTPSPGGWLVAEPRPTYGVLAPSNFGHALKYIARRPVVVDNFLDDVGGDGLAFLDAALGATEDRAVPMLDARGVRYIIAPIDRQLLAHNVSRGGLFDAMASLGRPQAATGYVEPPSRLRLLLELAYRPPDHVQAQPLFRVFERVPGALLVGRSEPGSEISAALQLTLRMGHAITYRRTTHADAEGAWSLRVPYANVDAPPSILPASHYVVACSGGATRVAVLERDIRDGSEIRVGCEAEGV